MCKEPFFSIIIPTYNRANLLPIAIESVLKQSFSNWELIVVDDGSTDNTAALVQSYAASDPRIKYIYQQNSERSVARNNGIKHSQGTYICFLDSDDFYLSNRLELLFQFLINLTNELGFYYTAISYQTESGIEERKELSRGDLSIFDFIFLAIIGTPQVVVSKRLLLLEEFNPSLTIGEDMELWLRLVRHTEIRFIENQATVVATDHENRSVNFRKRNTAKIQLETLRICFSPNHPGAAVTKEVKAKVIANAYLTIFKYWMYQRSRSKSILYLIKSILAHPTNAQTKYKVNLILRVLIFQRWSKIEKVL